MIPACRRMAEMLIALVAAPLCTQAAASLSAYRCSIVLEPGNRAHVIAEIAIDGIGAGAAMEFTRIAYPGQNVGGLRFRTNGSDLQWRSTFENVLSDIESPFRQTPFPPISNFARVWNISSSRPPAMGLQEYLSSSRPRRTRGLWN